jgi:hypothetical protein
MPTPGALPDRLEQRDEVRGHEVVHRFANGLQVLAEVGHKDDPLRILPLGRQQGAVLNHLVGFPALARGRRVFEPFAGSGAFGFMALRMGARRAAFLDVNPRALDFMRRTAALNGIAPGRVELHHGDIERFRPAERYDLILANPPYIPVPEGIGGTLTSNAGPDGNRFARILLERLDALLEPRGELLMYLFQITRGGRPLVADVMEEMLENRPVELTPCQERPLPFEALYRAYLRVHPGAAAEVERWRSDLVSRHGDDLAGTHVIAHVGPRSDAPTVCTVHHDFAGKFGAAFLIPGDDVDAAPVDGRRR